MVAIIFGIVFILAFAYAFIPFPGGLNWTEEIIFVLKGGVPVVLAVIGLLCILIGLADLIDKKQAKKEVLLQKEFEEKQKKEQAKS